LIVLFSTLALLLVRASAADAAPGCDAPPGTAGTEQYCETLPAPGGSQDVTRPPSRPLGATLPESVAADFANAGVLGDVVMAMATGTLVDGGRTAPGAASPAHAAAAEQAEFDPRIDALSPGPARTTTSTIRALASGAPRRFQFGFGAALVLILICLAACSIGTRRLGSRSAR
jgi:hypothetical protein